jgi:hypothetical protein
MKTTQYPLVIYHHMEQAIHSHQAGARKTKQLDKSQDVKCEITLQELKSHYENWDCIMRIEITLQELTLQFYGFTIVNLRCKLC